MKKITLLLIVAFSAANLFAQTSLKILPQPTASQAPETKSALPPSKVDFDAFEALSSEVKEYRKDRIIGITKFMAMAKEGNTIILDTRSTEMYNAKHIKGAVHLNFSDFNVASLKRLIPNPETRILIYCNNNIDNDQVFFVTKSLQPKQRFTFLKPQQELTLALNIPTFINLYGYGYKNVYELGDLVSASSSWMNFEGTGVPKIAAARN